MEKMKKLHQGTNWKTYLSKGKKKAFNVYFPEEIYKRALLLSQEKGMSLSSVIVMALIKYMRTKENKELIFQSDFSQVDELDKIFG